MISAIAVDDEANALGIIDEFSHRIPYVNLIQKFTDPTKVLQFISERNHQIDLVFLDIQMNRLNGLTLATRLPKQCKVILTTAYPDYALQGFDLDVVDYLLKPFSFDRFERAIKKVTLLKHSENGPCQDIQSKIIPSTDDFIFVRTDFKTVKIRIREIYYIEGSGNYVTLSTEKGKIIVLQNLKKFEEQLMPYSFIRVHRSYIISLKHIESIEKGWIQINSQEIPIGEAYREAFFSFLNKNYHHF